MLFHSPRTSIVSALLIASLCFAYSSLAQQPISERTHVDIVGQSNQVSFEIGGTFDRLTLTVGAPDGSTARHQVELSSSLSYDLADDKGQSRPDGTYAYELKGLAAGDEKVRVLDAGFFTIHHGTLVSDDQLERALSKAELVLDDLVVTGSGCIGVDCDSAESFGVETLKLKEDNTRLLFEDVSNPGNSPKRDWMLLANEAEDGGAELFSIVDCGDTADGCESAGRPFTVQGGAPDNALFLDDNGRVGFGTNVPMVDLHIVNGNSPALRLEQDEVNWTVRAIN